MKTNRILLMVAFVIATVSMFGQIAEARGRSHHRSRSHHSNNRSYRGGRSGYSPAAKAYADMMRANAIRAAAVRAAQAEARGAYTALTKTRTKIQREFKYSPQLTGAEADLTDAHRQLEKAHSAVRDQLANDPSYQAAKLANNGALVSTLQLAAYRKDSDTQDAQEVVYRAAARVSALKKQFEGAVTSDPQWQAASKNLEKARVNVSRAQAAGNKSLTASARARPGRAPRR